MEENNLIKFWEGLKSDLIESRKEAEDKIKNLKEKESTINK